MINVKVLKANNIPIVTTRICKTKICIFSYSSNYKYYYGSFKNNENTTNPKWNTEFDADLFRCDILNFKLYSSSFSSKNDFIGEVNINMNQFLIQEVYKIMPNSQINSYQFELPISTFVQSNATLILQISYSPKYIQRFSVPYNIPNVTLVYTFKPSSPGNNDIINNPVEFELLQSYICQSDIFIDDLKSGFYYTYNKRTANDGIGGFSQNKFFYNGSGICQMSSFIIEKAEDKYHFFIIRTLNQKGTVTLNFICEKELKYVKFDNEAFIDLDQSYISLMNAIELNVEPNSEYCFPIYFFSENKIFFKKNAFQKFHYLVNKQPIIGLDYESKFISQIIQRAKSIIPEWNKVNFKKTFVLPCSENVSLPAVYNCLNLPSFNYLRFYVAGSQSVSQNFDGSIERYYWRLKFYIYDRITHEKSVSVDHDYMKIINFREKHSRRKFLIYNMDLNDFSDLDMDKIGNSKVVIFTINCQTSLSCGVNGGFMVAQVVGDKENLLFRNEVKINDGIGFKIATFFRLQYEDGAWQIFPMRYCFKNENDLINAMNYQFENKWFTPPSPPNCQQTQPKNELQQDLPNIPQNAMPEQQNKDQICMPPPSFPYVQDQQNLPSVNQNRKDQQKMSPIYMPPPPSSYNEDQQSLPSMRRNGTDQQNMDQIYMPLSPYNQDQQNRSSVHQNITDQQNTSPIYMTPSLPISPYNQDIQNLPSMRRNGTDQQNMDQIYMPPPPLSPYNQDQQNQNNGYEEYNDQIIEDNDHLRTVF